MPQQSGGGPWRQQTVDAARARLRRVVVVHAMHGLVDRRVVATRGGVAAYRVVKDQDRACARGIQEQAFDLRVINGLDFGGVVEVAYPRGRSEERRGGKECRWR